MVVAAGYGVILCLWFIFATAPLVKLQRREFFLCRREGQTAYYYGLRKVLCCAARKKPEKMFSRGKGGHCPPFWHHYFQPTRKGGGGLSPPKFLVQQRNLIANAPENTGKHRKTPQNAAPTKCCKTPQRRIAKSLRHKKDNGSGGVNDGDSGRRRRGQR